MANDACKQLIEQTLERIDGAYAPNTLRAYRADMSEFWAFCAAMGESALPARPEVIADFIQNVTTDDIKSATIRRKLGAISAMHRHNDLGDPTKHSNVVLAMRKMHRLLGRQFSQAHALNQDLLDQLLAAAGTGLRGKRDRALLLIAYDTLRRRSELTSLRIDDIEWFSDGHAIILLRKSKTDQEGAGKYLHLSARTCIAIKQWMQVAQITSGFLLRGVSMAKRVTPSLGHGQISRIYKHLGREAGLDAQVVHKISGHSLRVGGAQDMLKSGASLPQIMVKGGWAKPDTAMRYVERTVFASHHMR